MAHLGGAFSPPVKALTRLDCTWTKYGGALVTPADTGNVTNFQFVLEITGRMVGASRSLESSILDEAPHGITRL